MMTNNDGKMAQDLNTFSFIMTKFKIHRANARSLIAQRWRLNVHGFSLRSYHARGLNYFKNIFLNKHKNKINKKLSGLT